MQTRAPNACQMSTVIIVCVTHATRMGANWSIIFVSKDGEELSIPADVVSACSPVWRERLMEGGVASFDKPPRSEEACTLEQLKCFKMLLVDRTQEGDGEDSMAETSYLDDVRTVTKALPLIHKYDCEKLLCIAITMADVHCFPHSNSFRTVTNSYGTPVAVTPLSKYLTQIHLDFLVTLQGFYGPDEMTLTMKEVLAYCLGSSRSVRWPTKSSARGTVLAKTLEVQWKPQHGDLAIDEASSTSRLILEAFRISAETYAALLESGLMKSDISVLVPF